jgi:plastocyanin
VTIRFLLVALLAGCGGGSNPPGQDDAASIDGPPRDAAIDALPDAPTLVQRVTCPSTPAATVMTSNFMFTPATVNVVVGGIVRFAPENIHRVVPHMTKPSDPGMNSGSTGEVRCLQFTAVGAFNYQCGPHPSMEGLVTVTN